MAAARWYASSRLVGVFGFDKRGSGKKNQGSTGLLVMPVFRFRSLDMYCIHAWLFELAHPSKGRGGGEERRGANGENLVALCCFSEVTIKPMSILGHISSKNCLSGWVSNVKVVI